MSWKYRSSSVLISAALLLRVTASRSAVRPPCYTTDSNRLTEDSAPSLRARRKMLLAREFVAYLSRQLVKKLTPQTIETSHPEAVTELVSNIITEDLSIEDRLNDEVRDLLSQYSDYMRREGVSYQE